MKGTKASFSSSTGANSTQPISIPGAPRTEEANTMSSSATTSPVSTPSSHSRSRSFPFAFPGGSLSRSSTTEAILRPRSRSRSKSPGAPSSPPNNTTKPARVSMTLTQTTAQPKRNPSDPAVSPTASSPTSGPQLPKKHKPSPASTSHYGRHSNDWLFGGFSVTEKVKGFWKDDEEK
jgi:hypothetical protein